MNRYEKIPLLKTEKGKRFKKTIEYPLMERNINDIYIVGRQGDRLDNLAYKYYSDAKLWWIIARANNIGNGNLGVPIGAQIRIPSNHISIVTEYNKLNQ